MHIYAEKPYTSFRTHIATDAMRRDIHTMQVLSDNHGMGMWASALDRVGGFSGVAGTLLEQVWHQTFALSKTGIEGCTLYELPRNGQRGDKDIIAVPAFSGVRRFDGNNMLMLTKLLLNEYCVPILGNFETLDAFAALEEPFCDKANKNLCCVGFQTTVAERGHELKFAGGDRVRKKFKELFPTELKGKHLKHENMYIVFVTTAAVAAKPAWKKRQPWKTQAGVVTAQMDNVRQYVLVLPEP